MRWGFRDWRKNRGGPGGRFAGGRESGAHGGAPHFLAGIILNKINAPGQGSLAKGSLAKGAWPREPGHGSLVTGAWSRSLGHGAWARGSRPKWAGRPRPARNGPELSRPDSCNLLPVKKKAPRGALQNSKNHVRGGLSLNYLTPHLPTPCAQTPLPASQQKKAPATPCGAHRGVTCHTLEQHGLAWLGRAVGAGL